MVVVAEYTNKMFLEVMDGSLNHLLSAFSPLLTFGWTTICLSRANGISGSLLRGSYKQTNNRV